MRGFCQSGSDMVNKDSGLLVKSRFLLFLYQVFLCQDNCSVLSIFVAILLIFLFPCDDSIHLLYVAFSLRQIKAS